MQVGVRLPVGVLLSAICLTLGACGGATRQPTAAAIARSDVVRQLQVPESPYRIIYNPPVSLAKPPDTTAQKPKPQKSRRRR
jgi:hypothetical protein